MDCQEYTLDLFDLIASRSIYDSPQSPFYQERWIVQGRLLATLAIPLTVVVPVDDDLSVYEPPHIVMTYHPEKG